MTILIEMHFGDFNVGGVDGDGDRLAIDLVSVDLFDVDGVFETVDLGDFAFTALPGSTGDFDNVVFADGDGVDRVLFLEFLGERGRHDHSADRRRGGEMGFSRFTAG